VKQTGNEALNPWATLTGKGTTEYDAVIMRRRERQDTAWDMWSVARICFRDGEKEVEFDMGSGLTIVLHKGFDVCEKDATHPQKRIMNRFGLRGIHHVR